MLRKSRSGSPASSLRRVGMPRKHYIGASISANRAFLPFAKALPGVTSPWTPGRVLLGLLDRSVRTREGSTQPDLSARRRGVAVLCSCRCASRVGCNTDRSLWFFLAGAFVPSPRASSVTAFRLPALSACPPRPCTEPRQLEALGRPGSRLASRSVSQLL